ncbi:helix-turn-helix domain-containing protein [Armatimonas sp.]|uniref:helix-turn-helix domain-containing protein n=1 Tax=Armatimonas sp. TaxID=1872638 RepID=UPI00374CD117
MKKLRLSEIIREHRAAKGWTITDLANASCVDKSTISRIENEITTDPQVAILQKLSGALGYSFKELSNYISDSDDESVEKLADNSYGQEVSIDDVEKTLLFLKELIQFGCPVRLSEFKGLIKNKEDIPRIERYLEAMIWNIGEIKKEIYNGNNKT